MKININGAIKKILFFMAAIFSVGATGQGIPVYDNAAFINNLQQLANTASQLKAQYDQLENARQQLQAMTGGRGMENLLNHVQRDYLPSTWDQVTGNIEQLQGRYGGMAQKITGISEKNAVLTPNEIAALPPELQARIQRMRTAIANESAMSQIAYQNSSQNMSNIQSMIATIGSANDPKAIADLTARIQAEQLMLQNDAIKLAQLTQLHAAEQRQIDQQLRERAIRMAGTSLEASPIKIVAPGR